MTDRRRLSLLALLVVAASATYLIGNGSTALWDRDEPRYAQTSRQMLQSGDWVVPHYLDLVRTAKPALIYWCEAAAMRALGDAGPAANFAARLPSSVAISALLVVGSAVLWRRLGPRLTLWTAFVFATSGLTIAAAKMCITDAVLLLWTTVAQLCLYQAWRDRATWPVVIVWAVMIGLAGLTKGPVILGMQAVTLVALAAARAWDGWSNRPVSVGRPADQREPSDRIDYAPAPPPTAVRSFAVAWAKGLVAVVIVTAIVLPWVLMVNHRAAAFLKTAVTHDVWDRMMTPLEQHAGPIGYYFAAVWVTFFPWSLFLPLAVGLAWTGRADPRRRFALAAIVGPWVLLECVRTKLPHYFLPAFPFLAYLTADALLRCLSGEVPDLRGRLFKVVATVWAVVIAAVASAPWAVVGRYPTLPVGPMVVVSILGAAFAAGACALIWKDRLAPAAVWLGVGTLALVAAVEGLYLPRADFLRLSPRVAQVLIDHGVTRPTLGPDGVARPPCRMFGYMEPTLAWAQGGTIREPDGLWFAPAYDARLPPWIVMTRDVWDHATDGLRAEFDVVADEYGLAYADRGRWVHVLVVHRRPVPGR